MLAKHFQENDVIKFSNGFIGCVTKVRPDGRRRLALISPQGWTVSPHYQPSVEDYMAKYTAMSFDRDGVTITLVETKMPYLVAA